MAMVREPIAIVGIGCRLPGGIVDAASAWRAWANGVDGIVDIPDQRWDRRRFYDPTGRAPHRASVHRAGLLHEDHALFDAAFFGLAPREAQTIDPQQRLLAVATWEAWEDAGIAPTRLAGTETAVFVGAFTSDALLLWGSRANQLLFDTGSAMAGTHTMLSNRLSYLFDLRGPSMTVDTACSSSLVALHLACRSLWSQECTDAVVGGVNALVVPDTHVVTSRGQFLSKHGRCAAFSAQADGYVRSEGVVVLALRPLSRALVEGNPVYAVIRGTAANQDGRTAGIAMPSEEAQVALMQRAYRDASVEPANVSYVEAHGTGTAAGDPIEARAIGRVVGAGRPSAGPHARCLIGSVKTNVGHLEAAAGATGVLKAALCLSHASVPPLLHYSAPNPAIDLGALRLTVPETLTALPPQPSPRLAGVNSFGYGGTNAHAVLEEAPRAEAPEPLPAGTPRALFISARAAPALPLQAERWAAALVAHPAEERDLLSTAARGRAHHRHRLAVWGTTASGLAAALKGGAETSVSGVAEPRKTALVFSGMGPQWPQMGLDLLTADADFGATLERADAHLRMLGAWSLIDELRAPAERSRVLRTEIAQPASVAVQLGLLAVLRRWGLEPSFVIGHSVGEIAAAFAAGALDFENALALAFHRGRLLQRCAGRGGLLAVGAGADSLVSRLSEWPDVTVAADNAPNTVTLSGPHAALDALEQALGADGLFVRKLPVEIPYHGAVMEELREDLLRALRPMRPQPTTTPLVSTVTGMPVDGLLLDAHHWYLNLRNPVRFREGVETLLAEGVNAFVEVSPHPALGHAITQNVTAARKTAFVGSTLRRGTPGALALTEAGARLYVDGVLSTPEKLVAPGRLTRLAPKYAFLKTHCWAETQASEGQRRSPAKHPLLTEEGQVPRPHWFTEASAASFSFLTDHRVAGQVVWPAAATLELLLAALDVSSLVDVRFSSMCRLDPGAIQRLVVSGGPATVALCHNEDSPQVIATAREESAPPSLPPTPLPGEADFAVVDPNDLYASLASMGLDYGPAFRTVKWLGRRANRALVRLESSEGGSADGWFLHPTLVDGAIHAVMGLATVGGDEPFVPARIEQLVVKRETTAPRSSLWVSGTWTKKDGGDAVTADLEFFDETGLLVAVVRGLVCVRLPTEHRLPPSHLVERAFEPFTPASSTPTPCLVLERAPTEEFWRSVGPTTVVVDVRWWAFEHPRPAWAEVMALVDGLRRLGSRTPSRYVVLTRRAVAAHPTEVDSLSLAPLCGALRTAMAEWPDFRITTLDTDWAEASRERIHEAVARLGDEQELVVRGETWFRARLRVATPALATASPPRLAPDATYLVTGASSGIGLETARWLVARGARHLALLSRRGGETEDAKALLRRFSLAGVDAQDLRVDLGDPAAVERALGVVTSTMPPLRGVVHSAGVLDDRPLAALTEESLRAVAAAKADAAVLLHSLLLEQGHPLDWAVWFSSVSSLIGNVGQGNYVAANAVLDALTSVRRAKGLASTTIQWGVLGEVGMVARDAQVAKQLAWLGLRPLPVSLALEALGLAITNRLGTVAVVDADWAQLARGLAPWAGRSRLSALAQSGDGRSGVWALGHEARAELIEKALSSAVCRVLRLDDVDCDQPLNELGFDSLMAMEIAAAVRQSLPVELSSLDLAAGASIRRLAAVVAAPRGEHRV